MEFVQTYIAPFAAAITWIGAVAMVLFSVYVFARAFIEGMIEDRVKAARNELIVNQIVAPNDNVVSITSLLDSPQERRNEVFDQEVV